MNEIEFVNHLKKIFLKNDNLISLGIGDDCAVIKGPHNIQYLITGDGLNENVHFLSGESLEMIFSKLFVRNISDIYAMGGEPKYGLIFTSMGEKETFDSIKIIDKLTKKFNINIIGGDFNYSNIKRLTMVLIGTQKNRFIYKRSGAQAGNFLYLSGYTGLSFYGLKAIQKKEENFKYLQKHYHYFSLPSKKFLKNYLENPNITAAIDISDGLILDALRISTESNVKIVIEKEKIPIHREIKKFCEKYKMAPFKGVFSGGDDYELLFTSKVPLNFGIKIGYIEKGKGVYIDNKYITKGGYEYFT